MSEPLNKDAEAVCLRHRKLVRWMPYPGWWYHAHGWPGSGSCLPMLDENSPLVFIHDGKPSIPFWQLRSHAERLRVMLLLLHADIPVRAYGQKFSR